jgi:hypothetical protein
LAAQDLYVCLAPVRFNVPKANQKQRCLQLFVGIGVLAASAGLGTGSTFAQQLAAHSDQSSLQQDSSRKPVLKPNVTTAVATSSEPPSAAVVKPVRRSQSNVAVKGPYYVDFRARTAASYGHAFVWFGKTSERQVEVAGLHPAGDEVPYVLGHLMWVPSETGASYGDLDEQYLTASYRVYLSEDQAKKVFAYIKHLQATSPLWNAETTNCTAFLGSIATFMGLKAPFHLLKPEEYVNQLKETNGGRQTAQLDPDR